MTEDFNELVQGSSGVIREENALIQEKRPVEFANLLPQWKQNDPEVIKEFRVGGIQDGVFAYLITEYSDISINSDISSLRQKTSRPILWGVAVEDEKTVRALAQLRFDGYVVSVSDCDTPRVQYLIEIGREYGMECILEVRKQDQLSCALMTDTRIISARPDPREGTKLIKEVISAKKGRRGRFIVDTRDMSEKLIAGLGTSWSAIIVGHDIFHEEEFL